MARESSSRWSSRRLASLRYRIDALGGLRTLVDLPPDQDLTARQWSVIDTQLATARGRLAGRIHRAAQALLHSIEPSARRGLNAALGEVELELAKAFVLFDTYMDVLTQRRSSGLGPLLRGCEVLADDSLRRDHPALALIERPVVYCDRGFGAAIMREGIRLPDGSRNPVPLIQIPYSRLREKYNLTSICHEAGHEAMARLGLKRALAAAVREAVIRRGGASILAELFGGWTSEIGPDYWTFACTGLAQPGSVREILALPPNDVFRVPVADPHPPPYLRVLLSFEWTRQQFGAGVQDGWEHEWDELYPLDAAPVSNREVLRAGRELLPVIARTLATTRFKALGNRRLPDLFDLAEVEPARTRGAAAPPKLRPCAQLAWFRGRRERGDAEDRLDHSMTRWLRGLGRGSEEPLTRMEKAHA